MSLEATKIRGALLFNILTIITIDYIILYKSMSLEVWDKCRANRWIPHHMS